MIECKQGSQAYLSGSAEVIQAENKAAAVGRWYYSEPALKSDGNGQLVIFSKSSVAPAEIFEWGIDAEKQPFERYRWCENDFYEDSDYDKTISTEELIKQIEETSSILKKHGFDTVSKQYDMIKAKINSILWR